MSLRTLLSRLGLVLAGVLLAAGLQAFAFTQPASAPTAGDVNAPINTGTSPQTRQGVLTINSGLILGAGSVTNGLIVETGNVGIGTTNPAGTLDVENSSKTATICLNGNCTTSISSPWRQYLDAHGLNSFPVLVSISFTDSNGNAQQGFFEFTNYIPGSIVSYDAVNNSMGNAFCNYNMSGTLTYQTGQGVGSCPSQLSMDGRDVQ